MAQDPFYAWLLRAACLLLVLGAFHLFWIALAWTIGLPYAAALAIIVLLFTAAWVLRGPLWPALAATGMLVLTGMFYALLGRFGHFRDLLEPMGWTQRGFAVLALLSFALLLGLLADREGGALVPAVVLSIVVGLGFLIYADSRFLIEPILGPRPAPRISVEDLRRPYEPPSLAGVAVAHGLVSFLVLAWTARRT